MITTLRGCRSGLAWAILTHPEDKLIKPYTNNRIRRTVWYHRWHRMCVEFKQNPDREKMLHRMHEYINMSYGYRYDHIARSSLRSLDLALDDCSNCDICKKRFSCWTS